MEFGTADFSVFVFAYGFGIFTGAIVSSFFKFERLVNRRAAMKAERAIRLVGQAVKEKANG